MELTVLAVPGCPNAPVLEQRLAEALAGRPAATVARRVIADADEAARWGMRGSPTLLIDGRDPFAVPGVGPAVACRLYEAEDGRLDGAPTVAALRRAVDQAGGQAKPPGRGGRRRRAGRGRGRSKGGAHGGSDDHRDPVAPKRGAGQDPAVL